MDNLYAFKFVDRANEEWHISSCNESIFGSYYIPASIIENVISFKDFIDRKK